MRLLQVVPYFKPSQFGGPAINVYHLSKELAKRHDISVWTTNALNIHENFESGFSEIDDMKVSYFPRFSKSKTFFSQEMVKSARELVRNFDLIHLHDFRTFPNIVVSHYARKYDIPYILSARGALRRISQRLTTKKVFDILFGERIISGAKAFIAISEDEAREYEDLGTKKMVYVVPNGIDISRFSRIRKKRSFRKKYCIGNEKMLLFMGRLNIRKGVQYIVQAIKDIDCKLVIAGPDDGYLGEIRKIIRNQKLNERVIVTGFLDGEMKLSALNDADVFVYPSKYEAFGVATIEALAYNKPVVICSDCGIRDFVTSNHFGLVVNFGDVDGLRHAIETCFNLKVKSREIVFDRFSWKKIAKRMEEIYGDIVEKK